MRVLSLFCLGFLITLLPWDIAIAGVSPLACETIFQPSIKKIIDDVNDSNSRFLFEGKSFEEFSSNLSWLRKRKIRKLTQDLEIRNFASEKALERHAVELSMALFGQKESVNRWLLKSSRQRLEESTVMLVKEQLLKEGLLQTWGDVYDPAQISLIKKTLDRIAGFRESRLGEILRLPFALPSVKNQEISRELMYKVIHDGFNAHAEEVRVALKHQNKIEAYNTFRKLYSPVFFGVMVISHALLAYEELKHAQELLVQQMIQDLRDQRKALETQIPLIKQQLLETTYKAAETEFIKKWGEPPTPAEAIELRAKISAALNMPSARPIPQ